MSMQIAVADDDARFLRVFLRATEEVHGLEPTFAHTGRELIAAIQGMIANETSLPRVIFIDIRMESRSAGFDVLRYIRANNPTRHLPVVIMSSSDLPEDIDRSYAEGANAYFLKPVGSEKLLELIRDHLTYWSRSTQLPRVERSAPEPASSPFDQNKETVLRRGGPGWALSRLRQDILIALVRDIENCQVQIPLLVGRELEVVLNRLKELFEFRGTYVGDELNRELDDFCYLINAWAKVELTNKGGDRDRRKFVMFIKNLRPKLTISIRRYEEALLSSGTIDRLALSFSDIFDEFSEHWAEYFPLLRRSLGRYKGRLRR
jgi:CheY-like chemotaxis protein